MRVPLLSRNTTKGGAGKRRAERRVDCGARGDRIPRSRCADLACLANGAARRLGLAQGTRQIGAVLGRGFPYELIEPVVGSVP